MLVEAMLPPVLVNGTAIALLHAGGAQPPLLTDTAATALYICSARAGSRARRSCCGHTLCTGCAAACARREAAAATPCSCSSSAAAGARRSCCCRRIPCTGRAAARARSRSISCTSLAADHEGTVCHEQPTNQAPRPNRRARRQQIPDPKISSGEEEKQEGSGRKCAQQISLHVENFSVRALLQISLQRRRSQIAQITSHRRCPREKQKSRAAVDIWRFADSCKGDPVFF